MIQFKIFGCFRFDQSLVCHRQVGRILADDDIFITDRNAMLLTNGQTKHLALIRKCIFISLSTNPAPSLSSTSIRSR
jgi:hypothetical protein